MRRTFLKILAGVAVPGVLAAQSSKPQLGKGPFNGVNARVTAIRFFEGGTTIPDAKQRVNTTKFDALTTRFIYLELELSYPPAPKRTPFQVDCRFEGGPAGSGRDLKLSGTIERGWTGSYHAQGVGSAERGQWAEGVYRVSCREEGQLIAATQLEVIKSVAAVRKLGAAVVQMHFYQSLDEQLPIETRRYSTRFDGETARWIKTEFALVYPQVTAPIRFSVECAYVFPDKSVKRVTVERQIPVGWTGSVHAQGIEMGGREDGRAGSVWPVGKYSVSCWSNGEKMSEAPFEVFDWGTGNREQGTGNGKLRFYGKRLGSAADLSYDTTFAAGSYDSLYVEASVPVRVMADSTSFGCTVTDPAGITSGFGLKGGVMDKEKLLVAHGPVGTLDPPKLRGSYRVDCRTGARGGVTGGFSVSGQPEVPALDARVVSAGLFAGGGGEEPGDEAVPDVVWSAAKLKTLWVVALFDHPSAAGAGTAAYTCRIAGPRSVVLADTGPQQLTVTSGQGALILRQRLALPPRQHWVAGKYVMSCVLSGTGGAKTTGGGSPLLKLEFELTR